MSSVAFGPVKSAFYAGGAIRKIYANNQLVWPILKFPMTPLYQGGAVEYHLRFHVGETWRWEGYANQAAALVFMAPEPRDNKPATFVYGGPDNDGDKYWSYSRRDYGEVSNAAGQPQPGSMWYSMADNNNLAFDIHFKQPLPAGYWFYIVVERVGIDDDTWEQIEPALIGGPVT